MDILPRRNENNIMEANANLCHCMNHYLQTQPQLFRLFETFPTVYIFLFEKPVLYSPANLLSEINIRAKMYSFCIEQLWWCSINVYEGK